VEDNKQILGEMLDLLDELEVDEAQFEARESVRHSIETLADKLGVDLSSAL